MRSKTPSSIVKIRSSCGSTHALWKLFLLSVCFLGRMPMPWKSLWLALIIMLLGYPCREVRVVKMESFCLPDKDHSNKCGFEMEHYTGDSRFKLCNFIMIIYMGGISYCYISFILKYHFDVRKIIYFIKSNSFVSLNLTTLLRLCFKLVENKLFMISFSHFIMGP